MFYILSFHTLTVVQARSPAFARDTKILDGYFDFPPQQKMTPKQVQQVLRIMRAHIGSEYIQSDACAVISTPLGELAANRTTLLAAGVVERVCAAMDAFPASVGVNAAGCSALATLSFDRSFASSLVSSGGLERVYNAFVRFPLHASARVLSKACKLLESLLTVPAPSGLSTFMASKGFEKFMPMLIANLYSHQICAAGFAVMDSVLANKLSGAELNAVSARAFACGLLDWICDVIDRHSLNTDLIFGACSLTRRLACTESAENQAILGQSKRFVTCIFDVLRVSVRHEAVMCEAVRTLRQISLTPPGSASLLKFGALPHLLGVLDACPRMLELLGYTASTAANLFAECSTSSLTGSSDAEASLRASWLATVNRVLDVMSAHPSAHLIQYGGVAVILNSLQHVVRCVTESAAASVRSGATPPVNLLMAFTKSKLQRMQTLVRAALPKFTSDAALQSRGNTVLQLLSVLLLSVSG